MAAVLELDGQTRYLIENTGKFSVFDPFSNKLRTPHQRAIATILRPVMLGLAQGKSTHWFDWKDLSNPQTYEGLRIPGDSQAFDIGDSNPLVKKVKQIHMSLGGWRETALIGPDPDNANLEMLAKTGWLYGFRITGSTGGILKAQYCQLVNRGFESTLILRGPRDFEAIGLDPYTLKEVPLVGMQFARRGISIQ